MSQPTEPALMTEWRICHPTYGPLTPAHRVGLGDPLPIGLVTVLLGMAAHGYYAQRRAVAPWENVDHDEALQDWKQDDEGGG